MSQNSGMKRRNFLKNSAIGITGAGMLGTSSLLPGTEKEREEPVKIKNYRTLGRTGFKVSDISSGVCNNTGVLNALLDAGINYIDTAESYGNQPAVGSVIKDRDRKKIFITTKLEIKDKNGAKESFLKRTRKCLEELQTDYIDCLMVHMPENIETLKTEGFHAAMKQLKAEGRVRFVGVAHHGSNWFKDPEETMERVLLTAAADGRFDVFLLAYNFLQMDQGEKVLAVCRQKNIGATLMKVNPVGHYYGLKQAIERQQKEGKEVNKLYLEGLERYKKKAQQAEGFIKKYNLQNPDEIRDAAIRFVLGNTNVHAVCCSMRNFDDVNRYIRLSGTSLSTAEKRKLSLYKEGCGELYCRHACGLCEPSCPHHVPVNTIMRINHYFEAGGREKYAMGRYAGLESPKADRCLNCGGDCEAACPYHVPVQGMLVGAHQRLTLT